MRNHMQAATTAHFRKINMGGVSLLLFKTIFLLATMFSTTTIVAQPTLPETNIWNLPGISNMHDVVINCDMLQSYPKEDGSPGTIKAIAWDNGDVSKLAAGYYIVQMKNGHNNVSSHRFVKQ
ncbi:MAG TPA: hypothetical protein PL009_08040 [Flavipsychrobacter sp.]|nr:hypothetical protein [Flavipsychrobacter sp.]